MRRIRTAFFNASLGLGLLSALLSAAPALAQYGGGGGGGRGGGHDDQQQEDDAKRKKRDEEFGKGGAPLPQLRNAGPCPYVKVLYDAARYVEFKDNAPSSANVAWSGEIQTIGSACAYKGAEPIRVRARLLFEFGRGPRSNGARKTYRYWVAVTDRDHAVLNKAFFDIPVQFPVGQDRVTQSEELAGISIPRLDAKVSGGNFEVLVGFDVTPDMAAFNRAGKRFRPNAGQVGQAVAAKP